MHKIGKKRLADTSYLALVKFLWKAKDTVIMLRTEACLNGAILDEPPLIYRYMGFWLVKFSPQITWLAFDLFTLSYYYIAAAHFLSIRKSGKETGVRTKSNKNFVHSTVC